MVFELRKGLSLLIIMVIVGVVGILWIVDKEDTIIMPITDSTSIIESQAYTGSYSISYGVYESLGDMITGLSGSFLIDFAASINSSTAYTYYFSIIKNGVVVNECVYPVKGVGGAMDVNILCELSIGSSDSLYLGVMIL